jgi:hypothetical protein
MRPPSRERGLRAEFWELLATVEHRVGQVVMDARWQNASTLRGLPIGGGRRRPHRSAVYDSGKPSSDARYQHQRRQSVTRSGGAASPSPSRAAYSCCAVAVPVDGIVEDFSARLGFIGGRAVRAQRSCRPSKPWNFAFCSHASGLRSERRGPFDRASLAYGNRPSLVAPMLSPFRPGSRDRVPDRRRIGWSAGVENARRGSRGELSAAYDQTPPCRTFRSRHLTRGRLLADSRSMTARSIRGVRLRHVFVGP